MAVKTTGSVSRTASTLRCASFSTRVYLHGSCEEQSSTRRQFLHVEIHNVPASVCACCSPQRLDSKLTARHTSRWMLWLQKSRDHQERGLVRWSDMKSVTMETLQQQKTVFNFSYWTACGEQTMTAWTNVSTWSLVFHFFLLIKNN